MFKNQGTSQPKASQYVNGDMASEWEEELVELDDVQLATVVGGITVGGVTLDDRNITNVSRRNGVTTVTLKDGQLIVLTQEQVNQASYELFYSYGQEIYNQTGVGVALGE